MSPSNELRDSLVSADSPWEIGRRMIRSPEASETDETYVSDEANMANEAKMDAEANLVEAKPDAKVNEANEVDNFDTIHSMNRLIIKVTHLVDEPLTDVP